VTRAWKDQLDDVYAVVRAWSDISSTLDRSVTTDEAYNYREVFDAFTAEAFSRAVKDFKSKAVDEDWFELPGYLRARPVNVGEPTLFPLVRFVVRVKKNELEIMVRLVTYFVNESETAIDVELYGSLDAHGWRFESPDRLDPGQESSERFHHYPHAQRIMAWTKDGEGLFPPGLGNIPKHNERLRAMKWNESRPAFPLGCDSPAGVVAAAVASLYGADITAEMVEHVNLDDAVVKELRAMLRVRVKGAS
jgi:hypothetical protein